MNPLEKTQVLKTCLKIYPISGYGNQELVRQLINIEKRNSPYTTPTQDFGFGCIKWNMRLDKRFRYSTITFGMIYLIQDIMKTFYESSDLIMNISKQTVNIVEQVVQNKPRTDWDCTYIPHGIPEETFFPIDKDDKELISHLEKKFYIIKKRFYYFLEQ